MTVSVGWVLTLWGVAETVCVSVYRVRWVFWICLVVVVVAAVVAAAVPCESQPLCHWGRVKRLSSYSM